MATETSAKLLSTPTPKETARSKHRERITLIVLEFRFLRIALDRSHAMAKELVARHDLERIAMQEIRAFPGCEHVTAVEIDYQLDRVLPANWTLHVFTREGGDMARIQYAINTTRKRLQHRYDLRTEA
jgi:hypothetical protein